MNIVPWCDYPSYKFRSCNVSLSWEVVEGYVCHRSDSVSGIPYIYYPCGNRCYDDSCYYYPCIYYGNLLKNCLLFDYFGRINSDVAYEEMGSDISVDNGMVSHFDKVSALHYVATSGCYDCQNAIHAENCLSVGTAVNSCPQSHCPFWWLESKQLLLNPKSHLIVQAVYKNFGNLESASH